MDMTEITIYLAGKKYNLELMYEDTARRFHDYEVCYKQTHGDPIRISPEELNKTKNELEQMKPSFSYGKEYIEYQSLLLPLFTRLLTDQILGIHGVGFVLHGEAWILTAPSGTGKTTQYLNMKKIEKNTQIINGDKLILKMDGDDFQVYSSPYPGKEKLFSDKSGTLKGIIVLEQGKTNKFVSLTEEEKIEHLYPEILYSPADKVKIEMACRMLSKIILNVPVFKYVNDGSIESSDLLMKTIRNKTYEKISENERLSGVDQNCGCPMPDFDSRE